MTLSFLVIAAAAWLFAILPFWIILLRRPSPADAKQPSSLTLPLAGFLAAAAIACLLLHGLDLISAAEGLILWIFSALGAAAAFFWQKKDSEPDELASASSFPSDSTNVAVEKRADEAIQKEILPDASAGGSASYSGAMREDEVAENLLDLKDTDLDSICTHRSDVISLSMDDDPARWRQIILANRHTFYPVLGSQSDDVVSILDTRDYFRLGCQNRSRILEQTCDKPLFVAENMSASELLGLMKKKKTYFAVVLDEYGGFTGIVTLHDIVEELFGTLAEADDSKASADITRLSKNVWRVSGEASLEDVSKAIGQTLQLDEFETFSGYVLGSLGYIPEDGTQMECAIGNLSIQIKRIKGHRIRQALVKLRQPDPALEPAAPASHLQVMRKTKQPQEKK